MCRFNLIEERRASTVFGSVLVRLLHSLKQTSCLPARS
jgi:hypothetical protein